MKTLHQLGHRYKWSLDSYFENKVGDGFIFGAYNLSSDKIGSRISGYEWVDLIGKSMLDLQFYANKKSDGGKLSSYLFHPANSSSGEKTLTSGLKCIEAGINLQIEEQFKKIIIPCFYYKAGESEKNFKIFDSVKLLTAKIKKKNLNRKYFMTVCIPSDGIMDDEYVEKILIKLTHLDVPFDGYYVVIENQKEYKQKIATDINSLLNTKKIFETLKKQGFKTIWGYANWDALLFLSCIDIDYISIGTYENLRSFSLNRYLECQSGGQSQGWYYSEKLLNFVKAQDLAVLRTRNCLSLIANENNVFSDVILNKTFVWNTHKAEVHKNYLVAIDRELKYLAKIGINNREKYFNRRILDAKVIYNSLLKEHRVYLSDESSNYHLSYWNNLLTANR